MRCPWAEGQAYFHPYHDHEWGVPLFDDRLIFEHLTLEAFQAGLSWLIVLRKREAFRAAFADFDPVRVAAFGDDDITRLRADPGIVRNVQKIRAAIANARAFCAVQQEAGSFAAWIWSFVEGRPVQNAWQAQSDVPPVSPLAERVSAELKRRGFAFVGPTIVYAHLQATGLINDHLVSCPRHAELAAIVPDCEQRWRGLRKS